MGLERVASYVRLAGDVEREVFLRGGLTGFPSCIFSGCKVVGGGSLSSAAVPVAWAGGG